MTWYEHDRLGRVTEYRAALSAAGPSFSIGLNPIGTPAGHRCFSVMLPSFVPRPAEPDVTYAYDALGRLTSVMHQAAVPSIATVTDAAGYQHAEIHDGHGERATTPQRRTGWLDRELDYETVMLISAKYHLNRTRLLRDVRLYLGTPERRLRSKVPGNIAFVMIPVLAALRYL